MEQVHSLPDSPVKHSIEEAGAGVTDNVCRSLEDLNGLVSDPGMLYNPYAWHGLQQKIRAKYTMEDEKLMFDKLLETGDVKTALEHYVHAKQAQSASQASDSSDVELF